MHESVPRVSKEKGKIPCNAFIDDDKTYQGESYSHECTYM